VPKPQLKESITSNNKNGEPKQAQKRKEKLPCYKNIPRQGKGFNHHEW